jgi:hypothetical protein
MRSIILYGLNNATYKIALGQTLLELAGRNTTHVAWNVLSEEFLKQYKNRLDSAVVPQQAAGQSVMHFHCHLIPRYIGEMDDPNGGVRGVIPSNQAY